MEELKKRLSFDDITVRSRCLQKLVQIVKRKSRGELITSSSVQVPELNLIWETCTDESVATSNLAVQAVIYLATNRHLDVNYSINKLLSSLSSTNNAYGIVKGISRLLIHENNQRSESNQIQYSLHRQRHPLIAVLQNNDDYLPLIFESIADAISDNNLRGFQIMEPVICYILSNPAKKRNDYSKTLLLETLIDTVKSEPKTAFYILRCIPFLQVEDYQQVAETSNFILNAKRAFTNFQCEESDRIYISELLLMSSLSLCDRSLDVGFDPVRLFNVAMDSSLFLSELNYTSMYINACLVLISMILRKASGKLIEKSASLALLLLDFTGISSTAAAFLAFSVIQLLPEPSVICFSESTSSILSHLLEKLENMLKQHNEGDASEGAEEILCSSEVQEEAERDNVTSIEAFTFTIESSMLCARFASKLDESSLEFKLSWLESIKTSVKSGAVENLDVIFSLVAALFLMSQDDRDCLNSCLETFEAILLKNTYLSTKVFALLLYKQNLLKSPKSKLMILEFLPKSATHKHSIPPVLSILKMMSNIVELKPQAIHLMLQLWKKHDRCFSYLHKLLLENNKAMSTDLGVKEALISQTAAIREICQISPEKRGVEFLGILSKVISESNDEASSAAACLALDGVINLCKSEITDIRSTWKVLGPKLTKDKRTVIMCRMFKLLALVPDFPVKSPEFDKFMSEIVALIWKRISSGMLPPEGVSCAYQTLAKFPKDCHVLKQLPSSAKENLQLPASMKATPFEMSKLPEDVLTYIPGHCFIDLLQSLDCDIIVKGYTEFLNSAIKQEIVDLPRSIYSQRKNLQKRQNADEALSKVPKFLCSQFEARRSLTLQRNLAVGVLLCYEPPLEMGKDGEPLKRSIASQCRFYEQVLGVLLNEVNIDTTEWQRCILLPSAWAGFMERAFLACEESRRAELELQRNLGHREFSPEEFSLQCKSTWLWVRDRLHNLIKTSVKNAATSHANAVFAVSGLVRAASRFRASLDDATRACSDENENHVLHQIFEEECTETIMCAMKPDYQPTGKVHSWLLTHLSRPNSSSAYLVRGCSCCALSDLAPVLISSHNAKIPKLFQELLENLSHSSPVLSFYSGVGLGLLTKSLFNAGYADAGESQMALLLDTAKQLQKIYLGDDPPSSVLVSLAMVMAALSQMDHEEFKDWISTTCNMFREKLIEEEISSMNFESLSVCVSAMIISAAEGGCVPVDSVLSLTSWFEERQSEQPQCSGVSVSCGMLTEALERFGHSQGKEIRQNLQKEWFGTLSSDKKNTLHRIAALNGLCSLHSCGRGLLQAKNKEENSNSSAINDLVSLMFQMLNAERDTGLQNICSWEVGRLFSVHCLQKEAETSVPLSYSYLGEKSVLKSLVMMITNSQKPGEAESKPCHLLACLEAIGGVFPRPFPPLNWTVVLTPFLEQDADPSLVYAALNVTVHHANGSPYAANLLASYSCPPLFHTLPESSQLLLFKNIPGLVSALHPHKLKIFLHTITTAALKQDNGPQSLCDITLQGIQEAFKLPGLKQQSLNAVQNTFFYIFKQFKKDLKLIRKHLKWISVMLSYLPEKKMESLLSLSNNSNDLSAVTVLLCFLVRSGNKSLTALRSCIEEGKHASLQDKEQICATLYECFLPCENEESEVNQPEKCISWLLQIIGRINVLNDSKSQYQLMTVGEVFLFLNDVCAATIIGCSGLECSYNLYPIQNLSHPVLLQNLPMAISKLSVKEEWLKITDKIITWLMMAIRSPHMTGNDKNFIKLSLYAVRGSNEFQDLDVWTDIVSSIY